MCTCFNIKIGTDTKKCQHLRVTILRLLSKHPRELLLSGKPDPFRYSTGTSTSTWKHAPWLLPPEGAASTELQDMENISAYACVHLRNQLDLNTHFQLQMSPCSLLNEEGPRQVLTPFLNGGKVKFSRAWYGSGELEFGSAALPDGSPAQSCGHAAGASCKKRSAHGKPALLWEKIHFMTKQNLLYAKAELTRRYQLPRIDFRIR